MFIWIYLREQRIKYTFCIFILCLNILALYCISDLYGYDMLVKYLRNGGEKFANLELPLAVLFVIVAVNLLFTSSFLIKRYLTHN